MILLKSALFSDTIRIIFNRLLCVLLHNETLPVHPPKGITNNTMKANPRKPQPSTKKSRARRKKHVTAYNLFFEDERRKKMLRSKVHYLETCSWKEVVTEISSSWQTLDAPTRCLYELRSREYNHNNMQETNKAPPNRNKGTTSLPTAMAVQSMHSYDVNNKFHFEGKLSDRNAFSSTPPKYHRLSESISNNHFETVIEEAECSSSSLHRIMKYIEKARTFQDDDLSAFMMSLNFA